MCSSDLPVIRPSASREKKTSPVWENPAWAPFLAASVTGTGNVAAILPMLEKERPAQGVDPATLRRCCSWQHWAASPLKRWWRENWFQPVVRIGALGNYEHVLQQPPPCLSFI